MKKHALLYLLSEMILGMDFDIEVIYTCNIVAELDELSDFKFNLREEYAEYITPHLLHPNSDTFHDKEQRGEIRRDCLNKLRQYVLAFKISN